MSKKTILFARVDKRFLDKIVKRYRKLVGKSFIERGTELNQVQMSEILTSLNKCGFNSTYSLLKGISERKD